MPLNVFKDPVGNLSLTDKDSPQIVHSATMDISKRFDRSCETPRILHDETNRLEQDLSFRERSSDRTEQAGVSFPRGVGKTRHV